MLHHIDAALLHQAYHWLKRDAAPGVDGMTWDAYGEGLEARLRDLESRIHLGSYRAQPSLRAYIPKPDGRQRPLGIAALEDKVVQRAVVEVLNAIYEQDFMPCSFGGRPGIGAHDALATLGEILSRPPAVSYVLDAKVMVLRDPESRRWTAPSGLTFRDWVRGAVGPPPTADDLEYHMSTLFPPGRPRGHLELRMIDAQPGDDGWIVPAAVAGALFDDQNLVRPPNRRQPMRNNERRPSLH